MQNKPASPFEMFLYVALISVISIVSVFMLVSSNSIFPEAHATSTTIGITFSNSCKASSTCNINDAVKMYDNTNQFYSGFFEINNRTGNFERQQSQFKASWNFYQNPNQIIIAVDPQGEWIPYMDYHITVEPSAFVYFNQEDFKINPVSKNQTIVVCVSEHYGSPCVNKSFIVPVKTSPIRQQRENQFIDNCSRATTSYFALSDTINQFLNKCGLKQEKYVVKVPLPQVPFEYKDSQWAKYDQWLKKSIQECKQKC